MVKKLFVNVTAIFIAITFAEAPTFLDGEFIQDGGSRIDAAYYTMPYAMDWDGDGKKDLLVGHFIPSKIRFYKNIGTDDNPEFDGYTFLQADGKDIEVGGY